MFCPRCGAENTKGNRYCVGCGADLPSSTGRPDTASGEVSFRQRLGRLIGTTPRARLLTTATALAILIAVVAFIALAPSDEGPGEDAYTRSLDRSCLTEKQTIAALQQQASPQQPSDFAVFAGALVSIVEEWRSSLQNPPPPPAHAEAVDALDSALLRVVIEAGGLARVAHDGSPRQVAAAAGRVDTASAQVERAIENLGLNRCADLDVATAASGGQ
jgi:hypothetical protein